MNENGHFVTLLFLSLLGTVMCIVFSATLLSHTKKILKKIEDAEAEQT